MKLQSLAQTSHTRLHVWYQHNLLRNDRASNSKKSGVCVYYKKLAYFEINWFLLSAGMLLILIGGKSCNFISLYRSPSQSCDSLEEFRDNLQLSLDKISHQNPFLTVAVGDFNAKY